MVAIDVIHEDNHLLGVVKPAGLLVQGDRTRERTVLDLARAYVRERTGKTGRVYLGLVHRIDRPVSGVVLLARTSRAASRLARAFAHGRVDKRYLAVVFGRPPADGGTLRVHLVREGTGARIVLPTEPGAREALLQWRVIERRRARALVEVRPLTGRHHQIRVMLAGEDMPVEGDVRYGAPEPLADRSIALHAAWLRVPHPVGGEPVTLCAPPPSAGPWRRFSRATRDWLATVS